MKMQSMKDWFTRVASVAVIGTTCGVIGGLGGYVALSYAAGQNLGGANDYQIPYQGMLELGGVPVDGPTEFVFTLYKSKDSVAAADKLWTSNPRTLQVSRGYFATVLGDETDVNKRIPSEVMAENILYIGMNVDGVELAGRQRILAVPYAQNGAPGKNFVVEGLITTQHLAVKENATVNGAFKAVGTSDLGGKVTANGGLHVNGGSILNGGATVNGGLTVNTTSHLNGNVQVGGNVTTGGTSDTNKLVQFHYLNSVVHTRDRSIGVSATNWDCAIGGVRFWGDYQESGKSETMAAYTYVKNNIWHVRHNFHSHEHNSLSPTFRVGVICFNKKISNRPDEWFDEDLTAINIP